MWRAPMVIFVFFLGCFIGFVLGAALVFRWANMRRLAKQLHRLEVLTNRQKRRTAEAEHRAEILRHINQSEHHTSEAENS